MAELQRDRFGYYSRSEKHPPILALNQADANALLGQPAIWRGAPDDKDLVAALRVGIFTFPAAQFVVDRFQSGLDADGYWTCDGCSILFGPDDDKVGEDCDLCEACLREQQAKPADPSWLKTAAEKLAVYVHNRVVTDGSEFDEDDAAEIIREAMAS